MDGTKMSQQGVERIRDFANVVGLDGNLLFENPGKP